MNIIMLVTEAALLGLAFFALGAYLKKHRKNSSELQFFQDRLFKSAKSFIEREDVDDKIADMALNMFALSGKRLATLKLLAAMHSRQAPERPPGESPIKSLSHDTRNKFAELVFDFLMVLKLRSVFWGWLVFPVALNQKDPHKSQPKSMKEMNYNIIFRLINTNNNAHC